MTGADATLWRPASPGDLGAVLRIQAIAHPAMKERAAVMADKMRAGPEACRIWTVKGEPAGYALGHPWRLGEVPALDTLLGELGGPPDCLFIHDVALLPSARGRNAAGCLVEAMVDLAGRRGLPALALVSVYGTVPLWRRHGFAERTGEAVTRALEPYGPTARYMVRPLA